MHRDIRNDESRVFNHAKSLFTELLLSAPCLGAPISRDFKDYSAQIHKETPPCECVIILAAKKNNSKVTKKLLTS